MLEVLAHIQTIDQMLMTAHTQLVDSVGVGEPDKFDLLAHHEHSVQDAILSCQDLTLLKAIGLDHLASEFILSVGNDFFLLCGCETTWV